MSVHHQKLLRDGGTAKWTEVRRVVLERDEHRCQSCNGRHRSLRLEVHHVVPVSLGGAEFDADNLLTLCRDCHFALHRPREIDSEWAEWAREW